MDSNTTGASAGSAHVRAELDAVIGMTVPERLAYLEARDARGLLTPSLEARRELLDAAILFVTAELGVPGSLAAVDVWNARVDAIYRDSLLWRRPIPPTDYDFRLRAVLVANAAGAL